LCCRHPVIQDSSTEPADAAGGEHRGGFGPRLHQPQTEQPARRGWPELQSQLRPVSALYAIFSFSLNESQVHDRRRDHANYSTVPLESAARAVIFSQLFVCSQISLSRAASASLI
jgi:hypothetical protein